MDENTDARTKTPTYFRKRHRWKPKIVMETRIYRHEKLTAFLRAPRQIYCRAQIPIEIMNAEMLTF
jgi:hypothetical protein